MKLVRTCQIRENGETDLDLKAILGVLIRQLQRGRVDTKLAVLKWIYHLFKIARENVSLISQKKI